MIAFQNKAESLTIVDELLSYEKKIRKTITLYKNSR